MPRNVSLDRMYVAAGALLGVIPLSDAAGSRDIAWLCDPLYVFATTGEMFRKSELRSGLLLLSRLGMIDHPVTLTLGAREVAFCSA